MITPVATTIFKRFEPKEGYVAPYIRLPWGYKRRLIEKSVAIYETKYGYALVTDLEKFKPAISDSEDVDAVQHEINDQVPVATVKNTPQRLNQKNRMLLWGFEPQSQE